MAKGMRTMRVSQRSTIIEGGWRANGHSALAACNSALHELQRHLVSATDVGEQRDADADPQRHGEQPDVALRLQRAIDVEHDRERASERRESWPARPPEPDGDG